MTDSIPPRLLDIAIVRFSALGDVVMVAAMVKQLRDCLPDASITWITSPMAYSLLRGMDGVKFEVYDKPGTLADYRAFYRAFHQRRFDVVLALQANLRINLLYPALRAPVKIGFDRIRAREGQWLFCNRRIPFANTHLVDSFLAFATLLGCGTADPFWRLPLSANDGAWARGQLKNLPRPLIAIHPHASKAERNWLPEHYAAVIKEILHRWRAGVVLTGGQTTAERELCARLAEPAPSNILNLCGQTTPKQLAAILGQADVLIAPDTGAVHIARAMNTPVIGLYAIASPKLTGPYGRTEYCVDRYPQALRKYMGKEIDHVPWNTRVHHSDAMSLIRVNDVMHKLHQVLGSSA